MTHPHKLMLGFSPVQNSCFFGVGGGVGWGGGQLYL